METGSDLLDIIEKQIAALDEILAIDGLGPQQVSMVEMKKDRWLALQRFATGKTSECEQIYLLSELETELRQKHKTLLEIYQTTTNPQIRKSTNDLIAKEILKIKQCQTAQKEFEKLITNQ